jgi:hypothetical protein
MGSFCAWRFGKTPESERHDHLVIWSDRRLLFAVASIAMAGWMARLYVIAVGAYFQLDRTTVEISTLGALLVFLEQLPFYAYVLLLVGYYYRVKLLSRSRSWLYGLIAIGAAEFIYWIGAGRKLETILVLVLALVARYLASRKLPSLKVIGLGALIVLLIFPVTFYYRYSLETSFGLGTDIASIPQVIAQATTVTEDAGPALDIILNRFNLTESVSAAMRLTETEEWGLLGGSSYLDIFLILIPRFLWSSKPDYHYGTEFGHASGLSALSDQLTSISVTYFGEAFLNLMWFGCLVFLVLGFLAEKLYLYASRNSDAKWLFLYCLSLPALLYVGGTAALNFGGLIRLLIAFYVLVSLLSLYRISVRFARRVLLPTPKLFPK